ncbi:hypothetical protein Acr_25g0000720 [Actinidia rufa]|uniref:Uncharacterized protein n=1 Tax=Actinidia rufa TaxID=165716 RepID=A0A7J0GXW4_9ERIC|nr:hypothetical protein Acr_25g0000720 [Actinidia rufa]
MDSPNKDQYLNDFIWVSGQWEFPADEPDPFSVPRHRGYVLVGLDSTDTFGGGTISVRPQLALLLEEAEGESSGSSESSSSSWDIDLGDEGLNEEAEVEDGEEVDQVRAAVPLVPAPLVLVPEPINLSSSDSNIAIVEPREIVEHSYSHSSSSSSGTPELWSPQFAAVELNKQVTSADSSKDHETCVALGNAVMLLQDVADHVAETTTEFGGKLVMLGAQWVVSSSLRLKGAMDLKKANQKANNLEKELTQTKSELVDVYKKLFDRAFERAGDVDERQLAELYPNIFQEGWLACLKELQIPLDHPAWSFPAPPVQLLASPE